MDDNELIVKFDAGELSLIDLLQHKNKLMDEYTEKKIMEMERTSISDGVLILINNYPGKHMKIEINTRTTYKCNGKVYGIEEEEELGFTDTIGSLAQEVKARARRELRPNQYSVGKSTPSSPNTFPREWLLKTLESIFRGAR